jgi:hypothetical protein
VISYERTALRINATSGDGYKTLMIQPNQLAALEVEAIRQLKNQNDSLKSANDDLRNRVEALETGRRMIAGINTTGLGLGLAGVAIAGAIVVARRRRDDDRDAA